MAEPEHLANVVDELLDSPGGKILSSARMYILERMRMLTFVFAIGFIATFPLTKSFISWLIEPERLPTDVEIIVIPVEFILLQVQLAAHVGLLALIVVFVSEASWRASKIKQSKKDLQNFNSRKYVQTVRLHSLSSQRFH